ncbi:hypothetical protein, partial [Pseudomonas capeferrum]|uniref:hypothetical protein n=1 Tax=Pseudomonas capeferrum TaxID=1495066 RepID=UPI0030D77E08
MGKGDPVFATAFSAPVRSSAAGARLGIFGAYEIERRPRGASRRKAAPTFVSGQLFLWHWRAAPWCPLNIASYKQ